MLKQKVREREEKKVYTTRGAKEKHVTKAQSKKMDE
jgi:hypothetical protein